MDAGLSGQRILVTGAAGGIGSAVVRALADEGAVPILHCHQSVDRAVGLQQELPQSEVVVADLRDEAAVDAMFSTVLRGGRLDALVVNAGIWVEVDKPIGEMSLAQWRGTMDANLTSAFLCCRGFFRHLAEDPRPDASVVLIGSTAGLFGEAGHADYSASKAAMAHGLTASLKNEIVRIAPRGRVNCICPGWVRTPMAEAALADPAVMAHATATMALQKAAEPEDVARAVVYFCSPTLSGHVTGTILPIDGGMEGRLLHAP